MLKHPQFTRNPQGGLILQERDLRLLALVHEHRFIDTYMLSRLLGHQGSARALQSRLQRLFHHSYLDRPPRQLVLRLTGEVHYLVYALGRKGAQLMAESLGEPLESLRWTQKNQEVGDLHLQHTLGIARFRTCLRLAIPDETNQDGTPECSTLYRLPWKQGEALHAAVKLPGKSGRADSWTLTPDGFFGLQKPKARPNRSHFFVEYQRSTPHPDRFVRAKGQAYLAYWMARLPEVHLGIKSVRVLLIVQTERKMQTLRHYLRSWLSNEKVQPWDLWLFTAEDRYNPAQPASILEPIWTTANEERLISLLD